MRESPAGPPAKDFEAEENDEANSWDTTGCNSVEGDRWGNAAQLQRPARRVAGVLDGEKDGDGNGRDVDRVVPLRLGSERYCGWGRLRFKRFTGRKHGLLLAAVTAATYDPLTVERA